MICDIMNHNRPLVFKMRCDFSSLRNDYKDRVMTVLKSGMYNDYVVSMVIFDEFNLSNGWKIKYHKVYFSYMENTIEQDIYDVTFEYNPNIDINDIYAKKDIEKICTGNNFYCTILLKDRPIIGKLPSLIFKVMPAIKTIKTTLCL